MDDRLLEAAITWSVTTGTPITAAHVEAIAAWVARWHEEQGKTDE